ncbi:MAG: hypothetical protein SFY95_02735, partial [Planctomycetota bacterium]|nr:hypothetical protein [Planctomycetota bacterium]
VAAVAGPGDATSQTLRLLSECLINPDYRVASYRIADVLGDVAAVAGPGDATSQTLRLLSECLINPDYREAWSWIARALGKVSRYAEVEAAERATGTLANHDSSSRERDEQLHAALLRGMRWRHDLGTPRWCIHERRLAR